MINENSNLFDFYATAVKPIGFLSIPHSGLTIPDEFNQYLVQDVKARNRDVDFAVDELVDIPTLQKMGVIVLVSRIHRICIDLNRDEKICLLNWKQNSHGQQLVIKGPEDSETQSLVGKYYLPYYQMIKSAIENLNTIYKKVSVIDLHSMPSKPTSYHLKINQTQKMYRPDFCVSDISGQSCEKPFIDYACKQLKHFAQGEVTQNDPYFGGHVTRHINATFDYTNNIQIEINRALYMDEDKIELSPEHIQLRSNLTHALVNIFQKFAN